MRHVRWLNAASVVLLLTVIVACASTTTPTDTPIDLSTADAAAKRVYDLYYPALRTSIDIYTLANDAVRAAHESGVITDEQVREISPKLRAAQSALETARDAATMYLRSLDADGTIGTGVHSQLTTQFLLAQSAVNALLKLAQDLGVIQ